MEKKGFLNGMFIITLALSVVFMGCGSSPSSTKKSEPEKPVVSVPDIDYSKIGPYDSVILAYLDPQLVKTVRPTDTDISGMLTLSIIAGTTGEVVSPPLVNIKYSPERTINFAQSCQIQIPNGTHRVYVLRIGATSGTQDILPFEVSFENVAITYKIRLATAEEKRAGGLGLGNEVYTMEEVSQKKLR
ncbi:MAG: hypothetical protein LBU82_05515 [Treponema sp.]|jgi:hypothetical protein|nr:hypothetical protein [Treponema sp.]